MKRVLVSVVHGGFRGTGYEPGPEFEEYCKSYRSKSAELFPARTGPPPSAGARAGTPRPSSASSRPAGVLGSERRSRSPSCTQSVPPYRSRWTRSTPSRSPVTRRPGSVGLKNPIGIPSDRSFQPRADSVHDHPHRRLALPVQVRVRRRPRLHRPHLPAHLLGRLSTSRSAPSPSSASGPSSPAPGPASRPSTGPAFSR